MKTKLFLFAVVGTLPLMLWAQDDDMYFIPSKKSKNAETTVVTPTREVYVPTNRMRDVDEYNRRGAIRKRENPEVVMTDTLGMQWMLTQNEKGESVWVPVEDVQPVTSPDYSQAYQDGYEDAMENYYSRRLSRFHGYAYYPSYRFYDPWYDEPFFQMHLLLQFQ